MSPSAQLSRADFESLLHDHQRLIELVNDLEYQMYRLGELPAGERVTECQQAGGALVGMLRNVLFRHDQQVFPFLDASLSGKQPFG